MALPHTRSFERGTRSEIVVLICVVQFILICIPKDHTISKEFVVLLCLARGGVSIMRAVDPS